MANGPDRRVLLMKVSCVMPVTANPRTQRCKRRVSARRPVSYLVVEAKSRRRGNSKIENGMGAEAAMQEARSRLAPYCIVCDHDAEDRATLERHLLMTT